MKSSSMVFCSIQVQGRGKCEGSGMQNACSDLPAQAGQATEG